MLVNPLNLSKLKETVTEHLQRNSNLFNCKSQVLNNIDSIFNKIT